MESPYRFNPRTHTGCDNEIHIPTIKAENVSIHAPTRGATFGFNYKPFDDEFQSTHPHGVRRPSPRLTRIPPCFNPRTHTGCDLSLPCFACFFHRFQSTHPHGVRRFFPIKSACSGLFQSTHPHGVRPNHGALYECRICFNPRTHTGCDISRKMTVKSNSSFNPRTHTGCDPWVHRFDLRITVSIHAPTRGATKIRNVWWISVKQFQSTHPHGVRQCAKLHIISQ